MNANTPTIRTLAVLVLAASLATAGCVASVKDELDTSSAADGDHNIEIQLTATGVPEGLSHMGLVLKEIYIHDAEAAATDGFYELDLATSHVDLVVNGTTATALAATATVPAGTYDEVLIQLRSMDTPQAGTDDHDHGDGDHDHGDTGSTAGSIGATDLSVDVTFEVTDDATTGVELVIDGGQLSDASDLSSVIKQATITQDGEVVSEETDVTVEIRAGGGQPSTMPPVARIGAFAPDGAKVYEADFQAESGDFVNTKASAFPANTSLRFSGADSEAVEPGAEVTNHTWDFDDGATAQGPNVEHAFEDYGVFEVTLTITDSAGGVDDHMVRVIVLPGTVEWNTMLVEESFEEGPADWTAQSNGDTTWALDASGPDSSTAWHVGTHAEHVYGIPGVEEYYPGYSSGATATLASPPIELPSQWIAAGVSFYVGGYSEACCDTLSVSYSYDGGGGSLGTFSPGDWVEVTDLEALTDAIGNEVTFKFTFTSDANVETGNGLLMDDFVIGGQVVDLHNAHLLDQSGGHDHGGHSH